MSQGKGTDLSHHYPNQRHYGATVKGHAFLGHQSSDRMTPMSQCFLCIIIPKHISSFGV